MPDPAALPQVAVLYNGDVTGRRRAVLWMGLAASIGAGVAGCRRANDPGAPTNLPPVCDEYRRQLLRCMESSRFPAASKEAQRSALRQMLAVVAEEQARKDAAGSNLAAAVDNCRDSLGTLQESAKESCPGTL